MQGDAQKLVNMAQGQGALKPADQQTLHDEFSQARPICSSSLMLISHLFQVASKMADLLETTGDDAGDFEVNPDQMNIQTAANDAEAVIVVSHITPCPR